MSEKSAGKSSNDSQSDILSEHEDENVDEKYGEDAPLLEEKQSQLRINEIHTLKVGRTVHPGRPPRMWMILIQSKDRE